MSALVEVKLLREATAELVSLRAELEKARSQLVCAQWQPITSAPKDGTWILIHEGFGVNTKYSPYEVGHYLDGYAAWFDGENQRIPNASHWMPLPARPPLTDD